MKKTRSFYLPSEWYRQSTIQLTWPHEKTDWGYMLDEITECFVEIARSILDYQQLLIVCSDPQKVKILLGDIYGMHSNLRLIELPSNDTWARDHAAISVLNNQNQKCILDFTFNGWGLKFAADKDNQINKNLFDAGIFKNDVEYINCKNFVLEGGGIESDGKGTLLTTSECLLSPNRNSHYTKIEIEEYLKNLFGLKRILWLDYGFLVGDDTDSHVDTLVRFCDEYTIAYVKCDDVSDEHYEALSKMEEQLKTFCDYEGNPYKLIPLPMADKTVFDGQRLPATYANFLIMNEIILVPFYGSDKDITAQRQLESVFPHRKVKGVNCLPIIKQHGSLHCVTMQYPDGFI